MTASSFAVRNATNESQIPELTQFRLERKLFLLTCTDLGQGWGADWRRYWRVSNKSLSDLSQHAKYLLMAQTSASGHCGK